MGRRRGEGGSANSNSHEAVRFKKCVLSQPQFSSVEPNATMPCAGSSAVAVSPCFFRYLTTLLMLNMPLTFSPPPSSVTGARSVQQPWVLPLSGLNPSRSDVSTSTNFFNRRKCVSPLKMSPGLWIVRSTCSSSTCFPDMASFLATSHSAASVGAGNLMCAQYDIAGIVTLAQCAASPYPPVPDADHGMAALHILDDGWVQTLAWRGRGQVSKWGGGGTSEPSDEI